jgi:hypothetical protein
MVSQLLRAHVGIGWSAVAVGACAIAMRAASLAARLLLRCKPKSAAARRAAQLLHPLSDWHAAFGIAFVLLVTFMPCAPLRPLRPLRRCGPPCAPGSRGATIRAATAQAACPRGRR